MIKILQGSAVTQTVLGGLTIYTEWSKKLYPGFNIAITSVNVFFTVRTRLITDNMYDRLSKQQLGLLI